LAISSMVIDGSVGPRYRGHLNFPRLSYRC